ncbi:MAG: hypothetical protein H8E34_11195 [Bacteroidetes bacterium]|nr:hypothetical protein [Bacteroidota bacterium]MBL6943819.1 hypothetical protein [Bacteroidales bacterium]
MIVHTSFEDILYVVIGLAWIIFSYYNAKKKKKAKNTPASAQEKKSIFDSLIDEIGIKEEREVPYPNKPSQDFEYGEIETEADTNQETPEYDEKVFSYDDYYEEDNYNSIVDVIKKKPTTPTIKIAESEKKSKKPYNKRKVKKNVDLRKAVIYSEILKRVYF